MRYIVGYCYVAGRSPGDGSSSRWHCLPSTAEKTPSEVKKGFTYYILVHPSEIRMN